jgi:hypothetical protein
LPPLVGNAVAEKILRFEMRSAKGAREHRHPRLAAAAGPQRVEAHACGRPGREDVVDEKRTGRRGPARVDPRRGGTPSRARPADLARTAAAGEAGLERQAERGGQRGGDQLGGVEATAAAPKRRCGHRNDDRSVAGAVPHRGSTDRVGERLGGEQRERRAAAELERGDEVAGDARVRGRPDGGGAGRPTGAAAARAERPEATAACEPGCRAGIAADPAAWRREQRGGKADRGERVDPPTLTGARSRMARETHRRRASGRSFSRPRRGRRRSPRPPVPCRVPCPDP